jgi:molybdopterin converting factor subunit 1
VTLRVKVLYFASLRELFGKSEETVTLPPSTVGELLSLLGARVPAFAERRSFVRVARNEEFAGEGERLADGDVVALLPPVAGG